MNWISNLKFSDLPIWRRFVLIAALAFFFMFGSIAVLLDIQVYRSAPKVPNASTQQIFAVEVMHGSVRYVTASQEENIEFWQQKIALLIGIPFAVVFLVIATFRPQLGKEADVPGGELGKL